MAKNRKLHKLATTIRNFEKNIIPDMHYHKTYMYIKFSKIVLLVQSKPCTQIYLKKIVSCINLQLAITILPKMQPFEHALPLMRHSGQFENNWQIRYQITERRNYFHRRQMDRQTDGRTDVPFGDSR